MFPGGLTDVLPIVLLALAVGCGVPALIYLAFHGTLWEGKERVSEQSEEKPEKSEVQPSLLAGRKDFVRLPALTEGYVYISKDILEMLVEEALHKQAKPTEKQVKPSGQEKPPLIRRVGD
jgi:hypothetical protein